MRFLTWSDLHLEFGAFTPHLDGVEWDALLLAGDIGVGMAGLSWARKWFGRGGRPVLYVMGNHEPYGQKPLARLLERARRSVEGTSIRVLENDSVSLGGVRVFGATLWTDFRLHGDANRDAAMTAWTETMNDGRRITLTRRGPVLRGVNARGQAEEHRSGDLLRAQDCARIHRGSLLALARAADQARDAGEKLVVLTHHAPLRECLAAREPRALSPSYASDLSGTMERHRVALWVHGHTHRSVDRVHGTTRVVSNPRGYMPRPVPGFAPVKVVEV